MFKSNMIYVLFTKLHIKGVDMFGEKLKEIRKHLSSTQDKMAELLKISTRTYVSYERNENNPPYSMLMLLCKTHNVNLNWLIADVGEMFIPPKFEQAQKELALEVRKILREEGLIK